jgi:hypothetical protein
MVDENGEAEGAFPDLLHDLILIHCTGSQGKIRDMGFWREAFLQSGLQFVLLHCNFPAMVDPNEDSEESEKNKKKKKKKKKKNYKKRKYKKKIYKKKKKKV